MSVHTLKTAAGQETTSSKSLSLIAEKLASDIETARLAPERRLTIQALAKWLRTTPEAIASIIPAFLESQLLVQSENELIVQPIDRLGLFPRLDNRLPLEQKLAQSAALNASKNQIAAMRECTALLKRCALIGDIDGYMLADRHLEVILGTAAQLPDDFEQLRLMKREFRRAWLAYNRLRDLSEPAALRHALVESIAIRNSDEALRAATHFVEYLRRSF